jgi:hypothetical protein
VGLEQGPLSLVNTSEEMLERKSSGSSVENRDYGVSDLTLSVMSTLSLEFYLDIDIADSLRRYKCI